AGRENLKHGAVHVAAAVGAEVALDHEAGDAAVVGGEYEQARILAREVAATGAEERAVDDDAVRVGEQPQLGHQEVPAVVHVKTAVTDVVAGLPLAEVEAVRDHGPDLGSAGVERRERGLE